MTTEVAVLNRLGVALAADSAVTITGEDSSKVFDTGDKLYELCVSGCAAVGVMINGNMDLLRVPWELIIKDFREYNLEYEDRSMRDWMNCLLNYAGSHKVMCDTAENSHASFVLKEEFGLVRSRAFTRFMQREDTSSPADAVLSVAKTRTACLNDLQRQRASKDLHLQLFANATLCRFRIRSRQYLKT